MTPKLRQTHRAMWGLLAVLLPIGFVSALRLNRNPVMQQQTIDLPVPAALPMVVRRVDKPGRQATLRRSSQSADPQLELVVRQPFEAPSVVVRVVTQAQELAIGSVDVTGLYRFTLPDSSLHPTIRLVDELGHRVLQTIQF
ncbi:hypothetical protein [Spirosoma koreense]